MMMAMTMMTMMTMMMFTLWGGCSPPLLPSLELFPREKISLSIPLEVFSPDDDGDDDDDDDQGDDDQGDDGHDGRSRLRCSHPWARRLRTRERAGRTPPDEDDGDDE